MRFRFYDAYILTRMLRYGGQRTVRQQRTLKPLTDKQIARRYCKLRHVKQHRAKHTGRAPTLGMAFLLLLIFGLLLTIVVNMPLH